MMSSNFEMSDLGLLTYYLGIEVSQEKNSVMIKQENYAMKILKEVGMESCNATQCPTEPGLNFSKAETEPEVEATQFFKGRNRIHGNYFSSMSSHLAKGVTCGGDGTRETKGVDSHR